MNLDHCSAKNSIVPQRTAPMIAAMVMKVVRTGMALIAVASMPPLEPGLLHWATGLIQLDSGLN